MDLTKEIMDFSLKVQNANKTIKNTANVTNEIPIERPDSIFMNYHQELLRENSHKMDQFEKKFQKSSTPELLENAAKVTMATKISTDGQLTPPPRPMTSSELVGFTMFDDNDLNLDPNIDIKPCHSLPASPNHLKSLQMPSLYDFTATKHFTTSAATTTSIVTSTQGSVQ